MIPRIKNTYLPNGRMTVEPQGFGGQLCRKATEPYLQKQGGEVVDRETAEAQMEPILQNETQQKDFA